MIGALNILLKILIYIFNLILEIKYKIKRAIFKRTQGIDTVIENIYLIDSESNEKIEIPHKYVQDKNDILKYSKFVIVSDLARKISLNNDYEKYLLEIEFKKHNKTYLFNFKLDGVNQVFFPIYNTNDIKKKNMNKISEIDADDEYKDLLIKYGGPLNDFYISKDLGIPIKNIYDSNKHFFPFRNNNYKMEDVFFNEYIVGPDGNIKPDDVLILKNTLDDTKIKANENSEQYILKNYNKIDSKAIIWGVINWLFGRQKQL